MASISFTACGSFPKETEPGDQFVEETVGNIVDESYSQDRKYDAEWLHLCVLGGAICTFVFNGLLLVVLTRPRMKNASNGFLCVMAVLDILATLSTLPGSLLSLFHVTGSSQELFILKKPFLLFFLHLMRYPSPGLLHTWIHTTTLYVAMALAFQRLSIACRSLRNSNQDPQLPLIVSAPLIIVCCSAAYGPYLWGFDLTNPTRASWCDGNNYYSATYVVSRWKPVFGESPDEFPIRMLYLSCLQGFQALPLVVITLVTIGLVVQLRDLRQKEHIANTIYHIRPPECAQVVDEGNVQSNDTRDVRMSPQPRSSSLVSTSDHDDNDVIMTDLPCEQSSFLSNSNPNLHHSTMVSDQTSVLIIILLTLIVLAEIPNLAWQLMAYFHQLHVGLAGQTAGDDWEYVYTIKKLHVVLSSWTYPLEFFVYLSISAEFRAEFRRLFCCWISYLRPSHHREGIAFNKLYSPDIASSKLMEIEIERTTSL